MFILGAAPAVSWLHNLAASPCWSQIHEPTCLQDLNSKMTRHVRPFILNNNKPLKTDIRVIYTNNFYSYLSENKTLVRNED